MMAGGDLDGDIYWVSWNKKLISQIDKTLQVEPLKYSKPEFVKEAPNSESLPDHFIFYLQKDVLGRLANLHLTLCDKYGRNGPKHKDCVKLATLQSIAVDFAKHG